MKPVLYRYKDTESVIKVMDGYTPGEGWEPLYSQDQISSAVNAALKATAPDERVKELEAELAAAEIAIAEYRQQCLDNAAEIARLRSESEERLQNCAALVAEVERLRKDAEQMREALMFYAEGDHFTFDRDAWDTVSDEPQNYWCDEAGTATVEDGTIAKLAIDAAMKDKP